jgi:hypothetical protein
MSFIFFMFFLLPIAPGQVDKKNPRNSAGQAKNQEQTIYNAFVQAAILSMGAK